MPRVLHVISTIDPRAGGTASAMAGLATAQAREGLSVSVISTWSGERPDAAADALRAAGIDVALVGPATTPLQWHRSLGGRVKTAVAAADVVHIHAMWEQIQATAAAAAARATRRPYVVAPHGMLDPWSLSQSRWKKRAMLWARGRRMLTRASALHFTTDVERDLTGPLRLSTPAVIEPNGLDATDFEALEHRPDRLTQRYRPDNSVAAGGGPVVVFLGRLHHKKGLDLTIRAMARMKRSNAFLLIAGPDGDGERARLQAIAAEIGFGRLAFVGMVTGREKLELLADADVFVLSSHQENFGIGVIEALAAGTPVVVSDQVNLCGAIAANGVGAVTTLQIDSIAHGLDEWIGRGDAMFRRRAARYACDAFDWQQIARRWRGHYERLIRENDRPAISAAGEKTSDAISDR